MKRHLDGRYLTASGAVTELNGALWNGSAPTGTKALIQVHSHLDVQRAVEIAAAHGLPVAALNGGHDWVGRAISESGLTIDMRALNHVSVDRQAQTLTLEGGALVKHALAALPADRAFVCGVHTQVGISGLALGGGYGKLNYRHGLATDALQSAQVVLADGRSVRVDSGHNEDLFWALRGAGKNFAIASSLTFQIFPISEVLNGVFFIPLNCAAQGLMEVRALLEDAGDRLSVFCSLTAIPGHGFGLIAELLYEEANSGGQGFANHLANVKGAVVIKCERVAYRDIFDESGDAQWPKGQGYEMDSHNLPAPLGTALIESIVELARRAPAQCCIMLHDFHGLAAKVPEDATAFSHRRNHFNMQVVARWDPTDADAHHIAHEWLAEVGNAIRPHAERGGYPSVLGVDSHDRARQFYGANLARLQHIKEKYDCANRFAARFGIA
ncbi:FAD-binding oxidoreductase [Pseudomonas putida]|uniref:FAD-binding oxidoreductase n=1 Tax=Pseudomonas putida TaxID=303 RepID=UPI0018AB9642|nr:FAD-binding oxidoreductase [Pseudomonas putida]MBF8668348.1 FAD-binding oxidoreductase [Pseudomonas putida]MBF8710833.1 FAD-binding oxidoreductase [Pseudomonas putida]